MSISPSAPPNSERGYRSAQFLGFYHEEAGWLEDGDFHSFVRSLLWRSQSASDGARQLHLSQRIASFVCSPAEAMIARQSRGPRAVQFIECVIERAKLVCLWSFQL